MQQHIRNQHALCAQCVKQRFGKMKPGGGCGSGTVFPRINGLISLALGEAFGDVRRQRHFAHTVKDFFKHAVIIEPDYTAARVRGFADGRGKLVADRVGEAGLCAAAGAHKTFPMVRIKSLEQQKFHRAARFRAVAKDACRNDACGIAHEHIAGAKVANNVGKHFVRNGARVSVVNQKTGGAAFFCGRLRDQLRWKIIIKVACFQRPAPFYSAVGCGYSPVVCYPPIIL